MTLAEYTKRILLPAMERFKAEQKAQMEADGWQLIEPVNRRPYWRRRRGWKPPFDTVFSPYEGGYLRVRVPHEYRVTEA